MADSKSSRRRKYSTSSNSSVDSAEDERRKDLKERDEFANRLRKKDEGHTRKVAEVSVFSGYLYDFYSRLPWFSQASGKKGFEEAAKRLKMELEDRDKIVPNLRVQSRRTYLEKRKEDKVTELEADIADDEYLFNDEV